MTHTVPFVLSICVVFGLLAPSPPVSAQCSDVDGGLHAGRRIEPARGEDVRYANPDDG